MIPSIIARRFRYTWRRNAELCLASILLLAAAILGGIGWVLLPPDPFSIDSNPKFRVSAAYTVAGVLCFLLGIMLLVHTVDRRIRHHFKK